MGSGSPKIAIVCDWLISRGGAERVVSTISDMYPDAPIYVSIYNEKLFPELKDRKIITSFIQKLPFAKSKHFLYLPLMPYAFEQFDLSEFDIVISSSHSCAKGVITKPKTMHVCYCHSPMRYAWDSCNEYFNQYGIPRLLQGTAKRIIHKMRIWDRLSADRVDHFVTNSKFISERVNKYYRKKSEVIYPPVKTDFFKLANGDGQYFLAVGRLTPYKRFDLLVDVFNDLKLPLVIAGTGKEEEKLKKMAGRFITFVGHITDQELAKIYERALAVIFPQTEDFGIIPVEAMSTGKPVIAFADGGALETVIPGKTGLFFGEQTMDSLRKRVLEFGAIKWDQKEIRKHAENFSEEVFVDKFGNFINTHWEAHNIGKRPDLTC